MANPSPPEKRTSAYGPVMAGLLAHPQVLAAMELFDGEVTQVRLAPPRASRAAGEGS